MIFYMTRMYVVRAGLIVGSVWGLFQILSLANAPVSGLPGVASVIFWGSGLAAVLTYRRLKKQNVLVFYDNLQLPPLLLLGGLFGGTQFVSIAFLLWL
jgi:hypothetical protein